MNKRIALVVGTVGLVVFLAAGVAFAMVKTGTNAPDNITGNNVARGYDGDGDWVSVVDNDTDDFVSGGNGTDDVCVVDLVNGVRDEFSDTCEKVYQTASIPQQEGE